MTESKTDTATATAFAEWRGIVKTAIDFIKDELERLRAEDLEQWEIIEQIRGMMEKYRDRCDTVSGTKALRDDVEALKRQMDEKAAVSDLATVKKDVSTIKKTQIKQGVTLMFYGLIGGALFTALMTLIRTLK